MKTNEKCFRCEYEIPPLRGIFSVDFVASNEEQAKQAFREIHEFQGFRLKSVTEVDELGNVRLGKSEERPFQEEFGFDPTESLKKKTSKIDVGQKVCVSLRRGGGVEELVVTRVGRKYFYATPPGSNYERQFVIETMQENRKWGSPAKVYPSKIAYEQALELDGLLRKIKAAFGPYGGTKITLEQAREVSNILFERTSEARAKIKGDQK